MSVSPEPAEDGELLRLLTVLICDAGCAGAPDGAVPNWCLFGSRLPVDVIRDRDALLAHIAAAYVRRDDPRYRILDRAPEALVAFDVTGRGPARAVRYRKEELTDDADDR